MTRRDARALLFAASSLAIGFSAPARAQTPDASATHDPSRVVESNGKFFFGSTGGSRAASTDGLPWTSTGLKLTVPPTPAAQPPGGLKASPRRRQASRRSTTMLPRVAFE